MKKITALMSALLLSGALTLGACGENEHVKTAKKIEKKACSCKDLACMQEVQKMLLDFQKKAGNEKVVKSDADKIKKHLDAAAKCLMEVGKKK